MTDTMREQLRDFPMFFLFLLAYSLVHGMFELNFWSSGGVTVFDKYAAVADAALAMEMAERVYYAKATWFFALVILQACGLRFYTALAVSFALYSVELLLFFPIQIYSVLNLLLAVGMVVEIIVRRHQAHPRLLVWASSKPE
jgi:hypothetical protein